MAIKYNQISMPDVRVGDRVLAIDAQSIVEIIMKNGLSLVDMSLRLGYIDKDQKLHTCTQIHRALRRGVMGETEYKKLIEYFGYSYGAFLECQSCSNYNIWDYTKNEFKVDETTGTTSLERLEKLKEQAQAKLHETAKPRTTSEFKLSDRTKNSILTLANNIARECLIATV